MIGGGDPLYLKFWIKVTAFVRNCRFPLVAPQPLHLCENCHGQSFKAFIDLTIRAKNDGGRRALVPQNLSQSDRIGAKFEQAAITPKRYEIGCLLLLINAKNLSV